MITTDTRPLFRTKVAEVIDLAKAKLPDSATRLDAAMKIVLSGDLEILDDGHSARVYSQSNGIKSYELCNGSCTCQGFDHAPGNLCKHRLSWMLHTGPPGANAVMPSTT